MQFDATARGKIVGVGTGEEWKGPGGKKMRWNGMEWPQKVVEAGKRPRRAVGKGP